MLDEHDILDEDDALEVIIVDIVGDIIVKNVYSFYLIFYLRMIWVTPILMNQKF